MARAALAAAGRLGVDTEALVAELELQEGAGSLKAQQLGGHVVGGIGPPAERDQEAPSLARGKEGSKRIARDLWIAVAGPVWPRLIADDQLLKTRSHIAYKAKP